MSLPPALESEFELVEELPSGKFFQCYHVKDMRKGGADAVVRLLPENFAVDQSIVNRFHDFFSRFNDIPNRRYIPSVYSVVGVPGKDVYVVEEYCAGDSLAQFVEKNKGSETFRRDVTEILARVCEALHHAHQKSICHLCVLPSDILIDEHDYSKVKLVGFGAQIFAEKGKIDHLSDQSRRFVAPEVFKKGVFGPKADVYSLAMTIKWLSPEFSTGSDILNSALSTTLKDRFASARKFAANIKELSIADPVAEPKPKVSTPAESKGGLQPVVKIITEPAQAEVWCNGKILGVTTSSGLMAPWKPGTILEIKKTGYSTETIDLSTPPDNTEISIKLQSSIKLYTNPWGASVKVNGELLGTTTYKGLTVPWDKGEISVEKQGFRSETLRFNTLPSGNETFVELEPQSAPVSHSLPEKPAQSSHVEPEHSIPDESLVDLVFYNLRKGYAQPRTVSTRKRSTLRRFVYIGGVVASVLVLTLVVSVMLSATTNNEKQTPTAALKSQSTLDDELWAAVNECDKSGAESVRASLARGSNINVRNAFGATPLMYAVSNGCVDVVRILVTSGANLYIKDNYGKNAEEYAKKEGKHEIVLLLNQQRAGQTPRPSPTKKVTIAIDTDLISASRSGDNNTVRSLLTEGADPNARNSEDHTALMVAAINGRFEVVKTLLKAGADRNLNYYGWTALDFAKKYNYPIIVELLNQNGSGQTATAPQTRPPAITQPSQSGSSLDYELLTACSRGEAQKVGDLLSRGADRNARSNNWRRTPLIIAAENNHAEVVKVLLKAGADPKMKDNYSRDAYDYAEYRIVQLLRQHR